MKMVVSSLSGGGVEESKSSSQQQPCLFINDRENCRMLTNMFNNKPQLVYDVGGEIPEFHGRTIGCSFGEWVLLNGTTSDAVLVNLLSKEVIELPSLDKRADFCILTSHPYDPTCHIVYFCEDEEHPEESVLMFCQPRDKEFTIKKWDYEFLPTGERSVVAGKLFLEIDKPITSYTLGIIEFKESTFQFEVLEMDIGINPLFSEYARFFESSGELFVVHQINSSLYLTNLIGFEIFKADFLNKKWVSVKNLGSLALFISYETAQVQCASVESGIKANSIYVLERNDLYNYCIYNLEDGSIRMKPTFSSMKIERATEYAELDWDMMHCDPSFPNLLKVLFLAPFLCFLRYFLRYCSTFSSMERETTTDAELDWVMMPVEASFRKLLKVLLLLPPFLSTFFSMEREITKDAELDWVMMPGEASFRKLLKGDQESKCLDSEKENKASVEVEEVGLQNSWNMVPPELLNLIQLHLFGRDHAVFRAVCKAWQPVCIQDHSIPSIPALLSSTTLLELCESSSPLLMFQEEITISDDSVPIFRFFDPVHKKLYRTGIPELRGTNIQCSKDGWLLVCRYSDESIFFFNPLTQEKIELPRLDSAYPLHYHYLSFSSLPTCSNCLVVAMHRVQMLMYTLQHGEESWTELELELDEFPPAKIEREYGHCPVVLNGLHHFMCENRDMVVFNLKDAVEGQLPDFQTWPSKFKRSDRGEDFFLEIDGALAFVSVEADGRDINMYKWNALVTGWELMKGGVDFGGKEMFLSKRGSFMEKTDDVGGMGNTMFLPMIDDAKEGVFYSLATQRYHTFYSCYSSELPYNVDKFLNGVWVKPDRKIVGENNLKWFI